MRNTFDAREGCEIQLRRLLMWLVSPSVRRTASVAFVWLLIAVLGLFLGMELFSQLPTSLTRSPDVPVVLSLIGVAALAFGFSVLLLRGRVMARPWQAIALGSLPFLVLGLRGVSELLTPHIPNGLDELMSADWRTYAILAAEIGLGVGIGAPVASLAAGLLKPSIEASNRRIEPTASGSIDQ